MDFKSILNNLNASVDSLESSFSSLEDNLLNLLNGQDVSQELKNEVSKMMSDARGGKMPNMATINKHMKQHMSETQYKQAKDVVNASKNNQ